MRWRLRCGLLALTFLGALAAVEAREAAPPFTASTLGGDTFTNDSLKGQVTLIQFWATWCPYCRREQPIVDELTSELSGQGLVVLAVDVGETAAAVKKYLDGHPRSCPIVLTEDTNLVAEFAPHSFPLYVAIDRDGNIAGVQHGAAGEMALRGLLNRAGLGRSSASATQPGGQRQAAARAAAPGSTELIEVTAGASAARAKPIPATVFVLAGGERIEAHRYTIAGGLVRIADEGKQRAVALSALDRKATIAANRERGLELKIPTNPNEIVVGLGK